MCASYFVKRAGWLAPCVGSWTCSIPPSPFLVLYPFYYFHVFLTYATLFSHVAESWCYTSVMSIRALFYPRAVYMKQHPFFGDAASGSSCNLEAIPVLGLIRALQCSVTAPMRAHACTHALPLLDFTSSVPVVSPSRLHTLGLPLV